MARMLAFEIRLWSKITPSQRGRMIWKIGDLIEKHLEEFAQLESLDNGKPLKVARVADVPLAADLFRYMAGWATKIEGNTIPVSAGGGATQFLAYTVREPIGVVGQIIPWNFPLLMAAWKLGPALATGCNSRPEARGTNSTYGSSAWRIDSGSWHPRRCSEYRNGLWRKLAGVALAAHPDVDKVAFTGSTEVGKLILQAAAGNLKKVSLELGGKSPNVVLGDVDIDSAAAGLRPDFLQSRAVLAARACGLRRKRYFRRSRGVCRKTCEQHSRRPWNGSIKRHGASRFRSR